MKLLILSASLFAFGQITAQCVKLYVKAHLSGSPICLLSEGDYIEICEDYDKVNGCPRDFYIYDKGYSYGSLTYELSLDRGWSTHYMTLMVNPETKRFGFILQGQTAMYSFYTDSEMQKQRELEAAERNKQEQIRQQEEKRKLDIDRLAYPLINKLVAEKKYQEAESQVKNLFFPNSYEKTAIISEQVRLINLTNERKIIASIETLLNEKNTVAAMQKYNNLTLLKDSLRKELLIRFTQQFSDTIVDGKKENITTFLQDKTNQYLLSNVEDGKIDFIISQNGEIENPKNGEFVINALKNSTIVYYGFTLPVKTKYTVIISTQKEKVNVDGERYIFSDKFKRKTLYVSKKGKYYFNWFGAPFNARLLNYPQYTDEGIKKRNVNIEFLYEYKKVGNGIVLSSKKNWEHEETIKAKKGTGRKIVRILSFSALVYLAYLLDG